MEVYHNQEWARDERYSSFWAHYRAVEKWRTDHARMAEVACRVAQNKVEPYPRRRPGHHRAPASATKPGTRRISVKMNAEVNVDMKQDEPQEELSRSSASVEVEEMSDEMIAFFRKTLEHRRCRAAEKAERQRLEAEQRGQEGSHWIKLDDDEYVMADKIGVYGVERRTFAPPDEAAKIQQRRENARKMYGSAAERILAMETLVDMRFEQEYAKKRPPLWPNIPLKL